MSNEKLIELLKPFIKPAWQLKLSKSKSAEATCIESKFGGLPYAEQNENWPCCSGCNNELTFVAQLKHPVEKSLHSFFYCFDCFSWGADDEEKGQWLVRSYANPDMAKYVAISPEPDNIGYHIIPCSCTEIPVQTLPSFETLESLSPEAAALCGDEDAYEVYDEAVESCGCLVDYATFIDGYPKWIQSETEKTCGICGQTMEFFAQIDSEDEADIMWGDCGAVYLFRCPEHKAEFGFELQCY